MVSKKLALLVGALVLSLGMAELVLRFFFPQETMSRVKAMSVRMWTGHSDILPYRLVPGSKGRLVTAEYDTAIEINAHGYRGADFDLEKGDRFRILAVGDSFTFGVGVEGPEAYPALLEKRLDEGGSNRPVEVINAGFASCYYPDTYYLYLKEIGLGLDPDLILVGFFMGNDIDYLSWGEHVWAEVDEAGLPTRIEKPSVVAEDGHLVRRVKSLRYRYPVVRESHLMQAIASVVRSMRVDPRAYFNHWIYRKEYLPRTQLAIETVQKMFLAMSTLAAGAGVPLVVVMIPAPEQLNPERYTLDDFDHMQDYDLEKPQRIFSAFFRDHEIRFLDLWPVLRNAARTRAVYYEADTHWNPAGQTIASEEIEEYLRANGLVPQAAPANRGVGGPRR